MTLSVDLFFSFRSPYSYLSLPKMVKMVADYDVTVDLRPVYPLAVRVPDFFKRTNPKFLPYVAIDAAIVADPDRYERIISGNERDHAASGHWAVPTFVFESEPFFGQDRIDLLIWRMESKGLTRRSA